MANDRFGSKAVISLPELLRRDMVTIFDSLSVAHRASIAMVRTGIHHGENAVPQESTEWANVPCDIVIEAKRAECESEHDRLGIPKDSSEASAAPATHATSSCGYAGNGYRPIVDLNGVDPDRFECDLSDCQGYASHINPAQNAVAGAVGGAILGAAIGALIGDHSSYARFGAGVGAVQGGVAGAAGSVAAQVNVVRNCMVGRGYRVLQ